MTKEEKHLWYDFLKNLDVTINRQKVIGNYILDFYCAKYKIAIELDGSQHYEKDGKDKDILRDKTLKDIGITVLRYSNYEINHDFEGVCQDILQHMK
ncbi:MAG: DUF559 domain-containing protein [Lachnospiraceae bacterium]|nr:DUF559 domain-containing protein [Lachnospiraceae bacterium]